MNGFAYYNEIEPYAAQWLRNLIKAGLIANGVVDERSISDVKPAEIKEFTQCHFFAGIGVWSHALRAAGWNDNRPVWTGSCPCQPFSAAGKGNAFTDERHLFPHWFHLIDQCRPRTIFGEQVASKDGLAWLDLVQTDLETTGYASAAVDLCAAGVGAPHIRQRLWFVAMRKERMGHAKRSGLEGYGGNEYDAQGRAIEVRPIEQASIFNPLPHTEREQLARSLHGSSKDKSKKGGWTTAELAGHSEVNGFWRNAEWIPCQDGKYRAIKPELEPLVNGATARVGRLRAYGNAIVSQAAKEFIEAAMHFRP
ncbi:DNA cytosine methyltransferase [Vibrio phage Marilyn]|nr:DNA cytosine methyltransferase [Vibrio phage Marilyn]WCD55556.1 DNA cytosine methyltransferase [Vibrio phage Fayden]WCD55613.1 DNA cytosine methyltransferase [Vibrio phage Baybae]WCD55672.1 DNA cytosine methyltransferase [Vibrio phage Vaitephage]